MSLLSSIQLAGNALQVQQIGLQVVGQNIANANTPGYSREVLELQPAPTQQYGGLLLGLGVQVQGVIQQVNPYLEQQLRSANSDSSSAQTQQTTYTDLQQAINALGNSNIGTQLNQFVSSIQSVLNQPESTSVRNLAIQQGGALTSTINSLANSVTQMQVNLDQQVNGDVDSVNQLLKQVSQLNLQIEQEQGGIGTNSQAVGLLDQRNEALSQLSQLVNIKVEPQTTGADNVYIGGDYVVFEGQYRALATQQQSVNGVATSTVILASTKSPLQITSGEIAGLITSRDQVLGGFQTNLNQFASTLASEFNKVYASGQGTTGYQSITSTNSVSSADQSLENAGLPFTPVNGSFNVQVYNSQTQQTQTTQVQVSLNGLPSDSTLRSLAQQLNQISGVQATVSPTGQLSLSTTSSNLQLAFGNDTSGVLSALGLNTFFTGSTAANIGINQVVAKDPTKFAASSAGIGTDTTNAVQLAGFLDQPLESAGGQTITQLNGQISSNVAQAASAQQSVASGLSAYQNTLQGQELATSGVNIDEETVNMLSYESAYQASAKYISTLNQLLNTLLQL